LAQIDVEKVVLFDPEQKIYQLFLREINLLIVVRVVHLLQVNLIQVASATSEPHQHLHVMLLGILFFNCMHANRSQESF
jgi:hypothetical protein